MKNSKSFPGQIFTGHALLRLVAVLTAALPFQPQLTSAAVTEAWIRRYSNLGDSLNQTFHVLRDPAGDFLVADVTADGFGPPDVLLVKYSGANRSVLWQSRHHGPAGIRQPQLEDGAVTAL